MTLEGKRVALLIEDEYNLDEFMYPYHRFKEAGADVKVVGSNRTEPFRAMTGRSRRTFRRASARVEDFDAVIIPGGHAPDKMRMDKDLVRFVHDMDTAGKPVGAICHAGWMLVSAKILPGRNATSYYSIRDDMEAAGATWSDEEVVVDRNLVTSRTPADLPAFCRTIIDHDGASTGYRLNVIPLAGLERPLEKVAPRPNLLATYECVPQAISLRDVFVLALWAAPPRRPYRQFGRSPPLVIGANPCQDGACRPAYKGAANAEIRNTLHLQR